MFLKHRKSIAISIISTMVLLLSNERSFARSLRTENYTISITRNCPQEEVVCDNITYYGTEIGTGESILLTGKTVHVWHSDVNGESIPGRFVGYIFRNREYIYFVDAIGKLIVYKGEEVILEENGTWIYPDP